MDNSINSKHLLDLERPSTSRAVHGQSTDNEKTEDWAYAANGCVPANAFCIDDEDIFVHPAHVGVIFTPYYGIVPGMLLPEVGVVGVLPDCASPFIERKQYYALIGKDFFWRPYDSKKWNCTPSDGYAIKNKGHEWYLIGRCEVDGVFLVGMIFRKILFVRKNDEVLKIEERYEILCKKRK
ncbi:uncharacterized protein LOC135941726 [Cloeon dipterum]|uniref:uncharacterized protein LOC135941726 n=1 Tax=Cloeon dipterum TaxID=197152 RepID=UPI0032205905